MCVYLKDTLGYTAQKLLKEFPSKSWNDVVVRFLVKVFRIVNNEIISNYFNHCHAIRLQILTSVPLPL